MIKNKVTNYIINKPKKYDFKQDLNSIKKNLTNLNWKAQLQKLIRSYQNLLSDQLLINCK
jgi:hypothetical protein